jgi:uncharacterized protein (TIGR01777 family)
MSMRVTVTGATGMLGRRLTAALLERGDEVTVLSRDAGRAGRALPGTSPFEWDPVAGPAPEAALAGRDAVVHLASENIGQPWRGDTRRRIVESREIGTRNLVAGLRSAEPRPPVLVSASAVGYYGPHGMEPLAEDAPAGDDFQARVCSAWEREARAAEELGIRVLLTRAGVILDREGGALAKMLPFFKAGVGGPVAGGRQPLSWVHPDDLVALILLALEDERWSGPVNVTPGAVTNAEFSKALGRALRRPAFLPVPGFALQVLYGEMSEVVTRGQNASPERALALGWEPRHPEIGEALRSALAS